MPTSLLKTLFWGLGKGKSGRTPTKRAQNLLPALLKLPCANWGTKTTILHF